MHLTLSPRCLRLSSIILTLFYSSLLQLFPANYLPSHLFILLIQLFCCWFLLEYFKFSFCVVHHFFLFLISSRSLLNVFHICSISEVLYHLYYHWASLVAQLVKNLPAMQETVVQFMGWEVTLEKRQATHSSILRLTLNSFSCRFSISCLFIWSYGFLPSPLSAQYFSVFFILSNFLCLSFPFPRLQSYNSSCFWSFP